MGGGAAAPTRLIPDVPVGALQRPAAGGPRQPGSWGQALNVDEKRGVTFL